MKRNELSIFLIVGAVLVIAVALVYFSGSKIGAASSAIENVKCVFKNSQVQQKCYFDGGPVIVISPPIKLCSGVKECTLKVKSQPGGVARWKSSCGDKVLKTVVDGKNDVIKFECAVDSSLGSVAGAIPELVNVDQFVINAPITPFVVIDTTAEKDNFADIQVIRYGAKYREPQGLVVLVHVFDFNNRDEVDKTMSTLFRDIVINGWKEHKNSNIAVFLDETDHRVAIWTSGKEIIYVESFEAANKEIIDAYLSKYPSDLQMPI